MEKLLRFLTELNKASVHYALYCVRDSIMVVVPTPSKYWEIEFFEGGEIEVQQFGPASDVNSMDLEPLLSGVLHDILV